MLSHNTALSRREPFLLNLRLEKKGPIFPIIVYDEVQAINVLVDDGATPLARSEYLLATQTKTEARQESDDDD